MARRSPVSSPARRSPCPIAGALDLLGDRWTLLVVRDLFAGRRRYGDFAAALEKIPTNLLADRLRKLEAAGLVARAPYQDNPPRHEYTLTPAGEALGPILREVSSWGRRHLPGTRFRAEITGNPADSPFLPAWIRVKAGTQRSTSRGRKPADRVER
ncbi:MAG TPA: helix-turn-helix domain-containing protein [Opitutaceae bacterium]|nr:helix-turn-helix domain-containing protein [Opitutaceae bacterium]